MVGHLLKYHPAFVALKKLVMSGELGRVNYIYSNRLNFGKIRREENILWSFAPHDISMILALAASVSAIPLNVLHAANVTTKQRTGCSKLETIHLRQMLERCGLEMTVGR